MGITRSGQLDKELVLESNTTTLMANAFDVLAVSSFKELQIPVIFSIEYMENSALARAEWIKFFALFFNAEKKADLIFTGIEQNYLQTKRVLSMVDSMPEAMFGSYYQGSYFIPGGESLIPNLFKDAGASYIYKDQKTRNNIHISTESLIDRMNEINQWGFVLSKVKEPNIDDFIGGDKRMVVMAKKKDIQFFYCNTFYCDYFGMANLEPDVILKDLGKIFHPELFPEHQFVYFQSFK
jgi:iron complex transport system substrate-binding protein